MTEIEELKKLIADNKHLQQKDIDIENEELASWRRRCKKFVKKAYDEYEAKRFDQITFSPLLLSEMTTADDYIQACREGLKVAVTYLEGYLMDYDNNVDYDCINELERIFTRFRKVVVQLSRRHDGRETLRINDEYDVQDLLRSILALYYDDVRSEEWTPSYAGTSLRIDFFIPKIKAVIEVKKTRDSMTDKKLSEELIVDIEKYQSHPECEKIYCFVYDPDTILRNPAAIKNDLEKKHSGLVKVFIES